MTAYSLPASSREFIREIRQARRELGWSAQRLADECARRGMPSLNRDVLANLENGRRESVTIEEARALLEAIRVGRLADDR